LNSFRRGERAEVASAMPPSTSPSRLNKGAATPAIPLRYSPTE
jgi:hypothetical protein